MGACVPAWRAVTRALQRVQCRGSRIMSEVPSMATPATMAVNSDFSCWSPLEWGGIVSGVPMPSLTAPANVEKQRLEQKQRAARKAADRGEPCFLP